MNTYTVLSDLRPEDATKLVKQLKSWFDVIGYGIRVTYPIGVSNVDVELSSDKKISTSFRKEITAWAQGFVIALHYGGN